MPSHAASQRLFLVAHNRNHVRILSEMAILLREAGVQVQFVTVEGHVDEAAAAEAIGALNFAPIGSAEMTRSAGARDVAVVGNDWGPSHFLRKLAHLKRRGVALAGVVEGARFAYPNHYQRVDDLMCWGPSALELLPGRKHIVGSPAIEKALRPERAAPARPAVLINYKFTKSAAAEGPNWARQCAQAAAAIDNDYVLSAHPFNVGELGGLNVSHAPFSGLLDRATLLITRSSTVIYEALAAKVSVIYYPLNGERRAEFAEPFGAFDTAEDADMLTALVRAHGAAPAFRTEAARVFLERHVSFDPERSASQRMAQFVTAKLAARAEARPLAATGVTGFLSRLLHR